MKRKIFIALFCVAAIALGVFIDKSADRDIENSKPKVPEKKPKDNRLEKLLEYFEERQEDDVVVEVDKEVEEQNFTSLKHAAYTDGGFYVYDGTNCVVSYVDKKTCKMMPLCSKPDCFHNDMDCDAYYLSLDGIFAYDEKLYVVSSDMSTFDKCLYEMNSDGSGRRIIKRLFTTETNGDCGISFFIAMHKGCLYVGIDYLYDDFSRKDESVLYCFPLDSKERKEIFKLTGYRSGIGITNFDGDNIYINTVHHNEYDFASEEIINYYCYNIKDESITDIKIPDGHYLHACFDGKMSSDYNELDEEYNFQKYEAYYSDMDGKNSKCIYSNSDFYFKGYCVDSSYRYFITEKKDKRHLMVISHDGKEVYKTESKDYYMVWSDKEDVLLKSESTERYALCNIKTGKIKEVWEK